MSVLNLLPFVRAVHLFILLQSVNGARQPWASSSISSRRAFDASTTREDDTAISSGFKAPLSLFGCGKKSFQYNSHSLISINHLRGGNNNDDDKTAIDTDAAVKVAIDDETDDQTKAPIQQENITNNNKSKKKKVDNDDERYSRQMFALGARAHKLVRSTTAILDGPMGGKVTSTLDDDDVIIDGADGFDGLQGNGKTDHKINQKMPTARFHQVFAFRPQLRQYSADSFGSKTTVNSGSQEVRQ